MRLWNLPIFSEDTTASIFSVGILNSRIVMKCFLRYMCLNVQEMLDLGPTTTHFFVVLMKLIWILNGIRKQPSFVFQVATQKHKD
jgi:hypothetical protein